MSIIALNIQLAYKHLLCVQFKCHNMMSIEYLTTGTSAHIRVVGDVACRWGCGMSFVFCYDDAHNAKSLYVFLTK